MEQENLFSTDHDSQVMSRSRDLAETYIEKMEDPDRIKELIRNAEDILERAKDRLDYIWKLRDWNYGFSVYRDGVQYTATWLKRQHMGLAKRCDTCNERVDGEAPRLRVTNGPNGHTTARSKGVSNEYNCVECAKRWYDTQPPR